MPRTLRILAGLGLAALLAVIVKRLLDGRKHDTPPVAPWDALRDQDSTPAASPPAEAPAKAPAKASTKAPAKPAAKAAAKAQAKASPKKSAKAASGSSDADSTDPKPDGSCPTAFPIKAKLSSKIFHVPGGGSYERTKADRCYLNEAAAEADGLRQAKR